MKNNEDNKKQQELKRYIFKSIQLSLDIGILSVAYWLSFLFRFEFSLSFNILKLLFFTWPYVLILQIIVLFMFGVPSFSWRYIGVKEAKNILYALSIATVVLVGLRIGLAPIGGYATFVTIPLGVLGMNFALAFLGISGIRVVKRMYDENIERKKRLSGKAQSKRTILIGAGRAGVAVAKEVRQRPDLGIEVVGFIDDDIAKQGATIEGVKVWGTTATLQKFVERYRVDEAIITIAAASGSAIRKIVDRCKEIELKVQIIPAIHEILEGKVNMSRIREVTIEDLLGREVVELDIPALEEFIAGKRVLVTGAGGSIGSELCRQVCRFGPERLILVEQAENALFEIEQELKQTEPKFDLVPRIADVCDQRRLETIFTDENPHVVFHAAAHKHVPMMELNPGEAIKNNVLGTKKVADTASKFGVERFVMISTDKAVNPTSIMGTSKRVAEMYIQAVSAESKTQFVVVRFGNVLGSAGSVIPTFKRQILKGGPITVTHPEMKRYFMTIPEACQLVMQAGAMCKGGEIFILDMGEQVRILDLARDLIRLSGLTEEDVPIEFSGIRPGEKLYEELFSKKEEMTTTVHPKIFIGKICPVTMDTMVEALEILTEVSESPNRFDVKTALRRIVPEMKEKDDGECKAESSDFESEKSKVARIAHRGAA